MAAGFATPALAAPHVAHGRFERLRDQDLRVATVAYRLATANAARCENAMVPQLGFVLHSIDQYGLADRDDAARSFGLGRQVGVMAVVGGSPAAAAGLVAGDRLVSVNRRDLGVVSGETAPSLASVNRAQAILAEEMSRGAVSLRVAGARGERVVSFLSAMGCPSRVELIPGEQVNAWADGARVMIGEGLLRRCNTDDELALVIAHEMAHNLLNHLHRLAAEGIFTNGLLPMTEAGSAAMRQTEEEADQLAVKLVGAAKFDLAGAEAFMSSLLNRDFAVVASHPARDRRLMLLRAAIAELPRS
ncbi:MAG: hypothetical protein EOP60_12290 [Sphingomonadales bacterium]|nr:MAG: hypothetical protein EOP60_12290 [Sphingomonadales bacterium]